VPPLVIRHVVNTNLLPRHTAGLLPAGLLYLGAVTAVAGFGYAYSYLSAVVAQRAIAAIRVRLFAHLARLPVAYLDRTPLGDTISRATSDVETIDDLFTNGIATLVGKLASLVAVAIAMVAISPVLSAVSLVVIPPLALASRWLQVRVRDAERRTRVAIGGLNTQLSETVGGAETIRAFSREATFAARFRAGLRQTLAAQETSVRYNAFFTPVTGLLSALAIAVLLWVSAGGLFRSAGVNLGTLIAFVLLFQGFFAPIVALGDQWNAVQAALAGAERVFEVLNLPPEATPQDGQAARRGGGIVVTDVSFSYDKGKPVLRQVNLTVRPGERVAVVGRTGAGKSTLLALLAGLYEPSAGQIRLTGRRPRDIPEHDRRRIVGVVPQQVQLFSGSLHHNLTLGDATISGDTIRRVIALAGLEPLLTALPDGLDTVLAGSGGGAGGGDPVGDGDDGAAFRPCCAGEGRAQGCVAVGVYRRGGLVEEEYLRLADERPGECDELALPGGQDAPCAAA
jgi:ATP-binding cassette subfamily B protein